MSWTALVSVPGDVGRRRHPLDRAGCRVGGRGVADAALVATRVDDVMSWTALVSAPGDVGRRRHLLDRDHRRAGGRWVADGVLVVTRGDDIMSWTALVSAPGDVGRRRHSLDRAGCRAGGRGATTSSPGQRSLSRRGTRVDHVIFWTAIVAAPGDEGRHRHLLDHSGCCAGGKGATTLSP